MEDQRGLHVRSYRGRQLLSGVAATLFRLYKEVLSPAFHAASPSQCLYLPTCSEYAYVALVRFGPVRGTWIAMRRLLRCHPFTKGGFDPVPEVILKADHLA